jgi:hypothetical protein
VTPKSITARNRANAAASTGPRTAEGRAVSAMNARRHGATGKPDQALAARYLSVILDQPQISLGDLVAPDEATQKPLALAQAEARLVAAQNALTAFEEQPNDTSPQGFGGADAKGEDATSWLNDLLSSEKSRRRDALHRIAVLEGSLRQQKKQRAPNAARAHRLLMRYVNEAKAARRRALAAWLATKADTLAWEAKDKTVDIPKRTQIQL